MGEIGGWGVKDRIRFHFNEQADPEIVLQLGRQVHLGLQQLEKLVDDAAKTRQS
jgi:hypothetical protein